METPHAAARRKLFLGIEIPPDLRWSHFLNLYLASLFAACLLSLPAILQPAYLKQIINIPQDQAGSINAGLQNMSQVAFLLFVGLAGILSDRYGRRMLAVSGFLICSIFFILFGHAKDISLALGATGMGGQIFITFLIRFIIGIGIILCFPQTITLVADYTAPRDRGKGMALHGMMMSVGSIIVFGFLLQVSRITGLMSLFYMAGGVGLLGLLVSCFGLVDRRMEQKTAKPDIREIYRAVSRSMALKASYLTVLLSRVDIIIVPTFLFVWMVYTGEKMGISAVAAAARGGLMLLVMSVVTMLSWPVIGVLLDRWGRTPVIVSGLIASGTGFCLIAVTKNPFTPLMYLPICLIGLGFSASQGGANTLAADVSPRYLLGSILGGLNSMQPIGALFFLQVGGLMLDQVGYWSPFVLKGVSNLILGAVLASIVLRIKLEVEQAVGISSLPFTMPWEHEAQSMLQRVPGPFREAAVAGTEQYARASSFEKVTAQVVNQYRKELGM